MDDAWQRRSIVRLQSAQRVRNFLAAHKERTSEKGAVRKSNITDNDSAKMATSKGVVQGYTAVVAVDSRHQVIVATQAHGSGSKQSAVRQVEFFHKVQAIKAARYSERMRQAADNPHGRLLYDRRMATVKPVFGNLRAN